MERKIIRTGQMPSSNGDIKLIQEFNNRQIYTKGFTFNTQAATTNEFPIELSGAARRLYGITLFSDPNFANDDDIISLQINEESVITNAVWWTYNPTPNQGNIFKREAYFPISRSLAGTDTITLIWKSVNSHKIYPVFWMSNSILPE
jgi:hypothetical protein